MTRASLRGLLFIALAYPTLIYAQDFVDDAHGKEWRKVNTTVLLSWDDVSSVCPTDGLTLCVGSVGGKDLSGWVWGTQNQVKNLFSYWEDDILAAPDLSGAQYFLGAIFFSDTLGVTDWIAIETFSWQIVDGWTATANEDGTVVHAWASATFPVFNGSWAINSTAASNLKLDSIGVWLWRPTLEGDMDGDLVLDESDNCPGCENTDQADSDGDGVGDVCEGVDFCEGDANADGVVDPLDAGYVQARFGCVVGVGDAACDAADANADGIVDPLDSGFVQARFGVCPL